MTLAILLAVCVGPAAVLLWVALREITRASAHRGIPATPPADPAKAVVLPPAAPRHRRTDTTPPGQTATGVIRRINPAMLPDPRRAR